jgi:hypothetical protein
MTEGRRPRGRRKPKAGPAPGPSLAKKPPAPAGGTLRTTSDGVEYLDITAQYAGVGIVGGGAEVPVDQAPARPIDHDSPEWSDDLTDTVGGIGIVGIGPEAPDGPGPGEGCGASTTPAGGSVWTEADRARWEKNLRDTQGEEWVDANRAMLDAQWEEIKDF